MAQVTQSFFGNWTAVDLVERFGPIPLYRVRMDPSPGTATEEDVVEIHEREGRLFELIDGILVEKGMSWYESYLAGVVIVLISNYVKEKGMGIVLAPDGMTRLARGQIRIPDVSFVSWQRLRKTSTEDAVFPLAPDLAVEVISKGNTPAEMRRKLEDYFHANVQEVWYIDPKYKEVLVYSPNQPPVTLREPQTLEGTPLLPEFRMNLGDLFAAPAPPPAP